MPPRRVKPHDPPSRRDLLRAGLVALGALTIRPQASARCWQETPTPPGEDEPQPTTIPATQPASGPAPGPQPWWLAAAGPKSRVVEVIGRGILAGGPVNPAILAEALENGLRVLTGAPTEADAWRAALGSVERIAVKFNRVGAQVVGTADALARVIVEALERSGYRREQIALVECPGRLARSLGTRPVVSGWGAAVRVGGRDEELAAYLYDSEAIINVPLLKTHQIAGMSGALKNLSHALVRRPADYHADGCSPFVGQVVGSAPVSGRLRLNIVNALRAVVRNGPDAGQRDLAEAERLLVGFDPVAVDAVGLEVLVAARRAMGIGGDLEVRYLESAASARVGRRAWHEVELVRLDHRS